MKNIIFYVSVLLSLLLSFSPVAIADSLSPQLQSIVNDGVAAHVHQDYQRAVKKFTQALDQDPDFVLAYQHRCLTNLTIKRYADAISDCSKALNLEPQLADAYLYRGLAYYETEIFEQAIQDFDQSLNLEPHIWQAYYNRALAKVANAEFKDAITDYTFALAQAEEVKPEVRARIFNERGIAYFQAGNYESAETDFLTGLKSNANNPEIHFNLGCNSRQQNQFISAISSFNQALFLRPDYPEAYVNRGLMHHDLGNERQAIADLRLAAAYFHVQNEPEAEQKILQLLADWTNLSVAA